MTRNTDTLHRIEAILRDRYPEPDLWLRARQLQLGGERPCDLIAQGRADEVLAAAGVERPSGGWMDRVRGLVKKASAAEAKAVPAEPEESGAA